MEGDRASLPCNHGHGVVTVPRDAHVMGARGRPVANTRLLGADARVTSTAPRTVGGVFLPPPKCEQALSDVPVRGTTAALVTVPTRGGRALPGVPIRVAAAALGAPRDVRVSEMQSTGCHLGARASSAHEALRGVGAVHRLPPPEGARGLAGPPVGVTAAGTGVGRYDLLRGPPVSWAPGTVDAGGDKDTRDDWYEVRVAKPRDGVDGDAGAPPRLETAGLQGHRGELVVAASSVQGGWAEECESSCHPGLLDASSMAAVGRMRSLSSVDSIFSRTV